MDNQLNRVNHEISESETEGDFFLALANELGRLGIKSGDDVPYTPELLRAPFGITAQTLIDHTIIKLVVNSLGRQLVIFKVDADNENNREEYNPEIQLIDNKIILLKRGKNGYTSGGKTNMSTWTIFLALLSMAACSFGIGSTEFVPAGLLPNLAQSFAVSIPTAAWATSGYAIGVGVSGPLVTAGTIKMPRKYVLAGLMAFFVLGSVLTAVAPSFNVLMCGRVLTSLCHGSFFGIGAVVVSSMVPPDKKASAIALMFTGLTLANVVGVPLGTLLGQNFGWRSAFWAISALGTIGLLGITAFLPRHLDIPSTHLHQELAIFKRPAVWGALATTALGFSGLIACFTYIAPIMEDVTGFAPNNLSWLVALYGVGLVLGNILGGKLADRALKPALYTLLIGLAGVLATFAFSSHYKIPAVINLFMLGAVGFALVPALVRNVVTRAEEAPTLASTMNISAFNLGIALSVYLGGRAIDSGFGYTSPIWVGAFLAITALVVAFISNLGRANGSNLEEVRVTLLEGGSTVPQDQRATRSLH